MTETAVAHKVVYLSGPMTGLPGHNYPAFRDAADRLRERGFIVRNPAEQEIDPRKPKSYYLSGDVRMILESDAVVLLPNWENSEGALFELTVAVQLDKPVLSYPDLEPLSLSVVSKQSAIPQAVGASLQSVYDTHQELTEAAKALIEKKGHDYNRTKQQDGDTLFNLRAAAILGIVKTPMHGVLTRLMDKIMRLESLTTADPAIVGESVKDTCVDAINYISYYYSFWKEAR